MKLKRVLLILVVICLVIASPFIMNRVVRAYKGLIMNKNADYIQVVSSGKKLYIKSVKASGPTLWKGNYDGVLYCKNGDAKAIDISFYGNFFGIKGEENGLLSNGVVYHYELK